MRERKWKLIGALAGLVVAALTLAAVWLLQSAPPSQVTRQNADKIKYGMSGAEIEALLGPPGDYRTGPTVWAIPPESRWIDCYEDRPRPTRQYVSGHHRWQSDTVWIQIDMEDPADNSDRFYTSGPPWSVAVSRKLRVARCQHMVRQEQSSLDNLLWRAERQWRRWFS